MAESERDARVVPIRAVEWRATAVRLPPREDLDPTVLAARIANAALPHADRSTAALRLAYLRRLDTPVTFSCLRLGEDASILLLPGEVFVEYQLFAAEQARFVATAAYSDTGVGYVPLARSYAEGGYEVGASSVSGASEAILKDTIVSLLRA